MFHKSLILILLINLVQSYFDVQVDRFELLYQNTSYFDWSGLKVRKVNKKRSIVGDVKFFVPIGNEIMFIGNAYKKQGGEYRLMPYKVQPTPFCDFLRKDGKFWIKIIEKFMIFTILEIVYKDIAKGSNLPSDLNKDCPIKAVSYFTYLLTC